MKFTDLLWPAIGAGLVIAAAKMKGIPEIARAPMVVLGTLMVVKPVAFVQDKI